MGLGHANVCTEFDAKMAAKSWRCGAMATHAVRINQRLLLEGSFEWTSLALATIESITVLGALHASKDVKRALADRIG